MSQNTEILADLKSGKNITAIDALNDYGCFRLAARINDLRRRGHDIKTVMINRKGKKFAVYYL